MFGTAESGAGIRARAGNPSPKLPSGATEVGKGLTGANGVSDCNGCSDCSDGDCIGDALTDADPDTSPADCPASLLVVVVLEFDAVDRALGKGGTESGDKPGVGVGKTESLSVALAVGKGRGGNGASERASSAGESLAEESSATKKM